MCTAVLVKRGTSKGVVKPLGPITMTSQASMDRPVNKVQPVTPDSKR
jgi:hypothetical protein